MNLLIWGFVDSVICISGHHGWFTKSPNQQINKSPIQQKTGLMVIFA